MGPADTPRAAVPRRRLPRGQAPARSVVRVKSGDWPGVRLPTHRPSLLCRAWGSAANLLGSQEQCRWTGPSGVRAQGRVSHRVVGSQPCCRRAGLMWPPGLLLRLLRPARHSPCPVLSLPSRKARCCRPCPGPLVFLLLLHPQCGPAPHPLTPRGGAPWPMPRVDLHVRRPLCCCSQMDGVAAGQDALGRSPSPACQHSRPVACLSASPPWTGQTQATEPSRPSLAFEGHTEPSSQGSFKP